MNGAFEIGAVALRAQQSALETMANNIANVNTPAFKRADVVYSEVVANSATADAMTANLPDGRAYSPGGVRMLARDMISTQGELRGTANAMDLAIEGKGFIEMLGPEGRTMLWRGGRLEVNRDGLLTAQGVPLKAMITVPDDAQTLTIDRNGTVAVITEGGEKLEIGQIGLVKLEGEIGLERMGSGLFVASEDSRVLDAIPGEDGAGEFAQGMLEGSNVDFSASMIEMLMIQRAYAASAQIIQAADQVSSITNNLKR
jgi:flagellar basal-body rod protein FlgG